MSFDNEVAQLIDDISMEGRRLCFDEVKCAGPSEIAHISRLNPNIRGDVCRRTASDRRGRAPCPTAAADTGIGADQSTAFWIAHQQFLEYNPGGQSGISVAF